MTRARLLIGWPSGDGDLFFVTRFHSPRPCAVLELADERLALVEPGEFELAARSVPTDDVIAAPVGAWLASNSEPASASAFAWLVALIRARGVDRLEIPPDFPYACACVLERAGLALTIGSRPFFPERIRKTDELLREARRVAATLTDALELARHRLSSCRIVDSALLDGARALDARALASELTAWLSARGIDAPRVIVSCGMLTAEPHVPGEGALAPDQPILVDLFGRCRTSGLWGDVARTFVRGRASDALRRGNAALADARRSAFEAIRDGASVSAPHSAAERALAAAGFETTLSGESAVGLVHATGHGIGFDLHEPPYLSRTGAEIAAQSAERGAPRGEDRGHDDAQLAPFSRLETGQLIALEPGLTLPTIGAVRHEELVVVRGEGAERLSPHEPPFEI
ncbi:MAG: aminopeptidase P family protein [Myxococcales bacterium]|nr:aminopeptidase P family protein [Myxococcales bacterium]